MVISVFIPQDTGYVNQRINEFLSYVFGIGKYIIPFLLFAWGVSFFIRNKKRLSLRFGSGFLLLFLSLSGIISSNLKYSDIFDSVLISTRGGITGAGIFYGLSRLFGKAGSITVLSVLIIISIIILTRISLIELGKKLGIFFKNIDFRIFSEVFGRDRNRQEKDTGAASMIRPAKNRRDPAEEKMTVVSEGNTEKEIVKEPELIDSISRDSMKRKFESKQG